ncbi:DUF4328 domain-containing protein [Actinomadura harenae]|uniref:DUF4328 domain-containing protein n=1 Tax=Actinomadura harenae TaxID=2483351 RepID=A0A3M2LYI2_9ACTN|nr:DUF4328 domain-containing protein [Actinomadura harenae]RMI42206.1 DUF4328 domain-containing protein [Actinomadura harenae]
MPCALCGDIVPADVARCPACGAWARRRDFRAVGVAVFMLLGFHAFLALGAGISLLRMSHPLRTATQDGYDASSTRHSLVPFADLLVICAVLAGVTGVMFVSWLWRAYTQSPGPHRHRRGWVVLGWLVPVANLWVPPRLLYDVWVTTGRYRMSQRHVAGALIGAWWLSVLLAVLLSRWFAHGGAESLADARLTVHLGAAAAAFQALAATLAMTVVYQITRLQISRPD